MAGNDWEQELRNKLMRLAGGQTSWLVDATRALGKAPELTKSLVLKETEDDKAHRLVDEIVKHAEVPGAGGGAAAAGPSHPSSVADTSMRDHEELAAMASQLRQRLQRLEQGQAAIASQLQQLTALETGSQTRAASQIDDTGLQEFRSCADVMLLQVDTLMYDDLKTKAPEADGFAWDRGPGSRSEPQHASQYTDWWTTRVQQAADSLQLPLLLNRWMTAQDMAPFYLRHKQCPYPLSSKNDLICSVSSLDVNAVMGVALKKDLDDQALREAEVGLYIWDKHVPYPFLQLVTDLCRGGAAFWCEGRHREGPGAVPTTTVVRCQLLGTMREVYEFVARALHHLPDYVVHRQADLEGLYYPSQLQRPARVKFYRRDMEWPVEEQSEEEEEEGSGDEGASSHGSDDASGGSHKRQRGSDRRGGHGRQRGVQRKRRRGGRKGTIGAARSEQVYALLAKLCANADDTANLRDLDDFENLESISGLPPGHAS